MITKWATSSCAVIVVRLSGILQFFHLTIVCWIIFELLTWSLFFLFLIGYSKTLSNHLFLFLVIQTSCRFIWLMRMISVKMEINNYLFAYLAIGLSMIVKIGLFPGHVWGLYIYNSASMPVILSLSSIIKITPLVILIVWITGVNERVEIMLYYWIILSYVIVVMNMWVRRNLFSFIFFSGMFHIRNIIFILIINSLCLFFYYYLTYVLILLSFNIIYYHYEVDCLQWGYCHISNNIGLLLHLLRVAGFPPFPLFWYKLLFLYRLWGGSFIFSNMSFVIIVVIIVYLSTLVIFILKGLSSSNNWIVRHHEHDISNIKKVSILSLSPHLFYLFLPYTTLLALL